MNAPILAFEDLHFRYAPGAAAVLDGLSFSLQPGTVTALLGPNGAGKTTLLRLALGRQKPQSGRVLLAGRPLPAYPRRELGRWIGLLPQSENIPFEYSILEFVLLGRAPYLNPLETPHERDCLLAMGALQRVGLGGMAERSITTLSGGERQLVQLARALAQEPHLLLLDEPTSHLDLGNKKRLLTLLGELASSGMTLMLTTHEPEVADAAASQVVLMRSGRVLHAGPLEETLTAPLLTATYGVDVQVRVLEGHRVVLWA